ncbi:hypothetical protein POPTR_003G152300v4 [Populus trichocarpa]|uniref:Anaphase-promoting complex subunit 4 WD40 domain-containing protein n=1 Tax=Populus trichocarpa TaxID=3694 RepID=U5GN84_POPTR|nr:uncharacterized protein LOC18097083 isoform X8 [Populus trichocarpa]KAI5595432.1 hypothetical protein BDE02_03G138300 [Populus trichocarpa]PNT45714.2 hypothetical protein POPTR_003G152300v4 [Populus trichocarpa]
MPTIIARGPEEKSGQLAFDYPRTDLRFLHRFIYIFCDLNKHLDREVITITVAKLSCMCRLIMKSCIYTKLVGERTSLGATRRKLPQKRENNDRKLSRSVKRIRADMVEISEGQKRIREGQKEIRKRFQEISEEAAKLREETNVISKQSSENQLRLDLMFQIVKARAENDYAKDALLTQTLRDLMGKRNLSKSNPSEEKQEEQ